MASFIITVLLIISYLATEYLGTEKRNNKFWVKVIIVSLVILARDGVNFFDSFSKENKQRKDIELSILDDFKNNTEVIYTWQTCLNKNWTPKRIITTTMNRFDLINLLKDSKLKNKISVTYKSLLEAEERIKIFRDGKGFENKEEVDTIKKYLVLCQNQLLESIDSLENDLYGKKNEKIQKSSNLTDEQIIKLYMDPTSTDIRSTASGSVVEVKPFLNIQK